MLLIHQLTKPSSLKDFSFLDYERPDDILTAGKLLTIVRGGVAFLCFHCQDFFQLFIVSMDIAVMYVNMNNEIYNMILNNILVVGCHW